MASYPPPPPPPGYGPPPGSYGGYPQARSTHGKAIASLVCGIAAFITCLTPLGIAAVILAPQAKREIAAEPDRYDGLGMAQAGQILGWIAIALTVLSVLAFIILLIIGAAASNDSSFESLSALAA